MPFVQAKCPNCGGFLAVDNAKDAAICQFCNTPFIVEKAINNYNITVNQNLKIDRATVKVEGAPTINNLLTRARQFVLSKNYGAALDYYDRALDLDPYNKEARRMVDRITVPQSENLLIRRDKAFHGRKAGVVIYIDGNDIGIVYNGQSAKFFIPFGEHVISFSEVDQRPIPFYLPSALQYASFRILAGGFGWEVRGGVYDRDEF